MTKPEKPIFVVANTQFQEPQSAYKMLFNTFDKANIDRREAWNAFADVFYEHYEVPEENHP